MAERLSNIRMVMLRRAICVTVVCLAGFVSSVAVGADFENDQADYFETYVRPLFVEKCSECHGTETQWSDLRVDSREALLKGGEHGPAVVVGEAEKSLLVQAIRRTSDSPMPPDDPLSSEQIERIVQWIDSGAFWPESSAVNQDEEAWKLHWAFQPIVAPELPENQFPEWVRNEIDLFIAARLEEDHLKPAKPVDTQVLLRRMSYDVTGLPPKAETIEAWTANLVEIDDDCRSLNLVDQFLSTREYGEHWARLWLDVARYSDTKGYVYAREEKNFIHSHVYRDWVIQAFCKDVPYDEFVKLQLAADMITKAGDPDRAAMGFLTLGRRFIGVSHDIIDDRIDVVTRGLMGLTAACARCHDHKYDPIPTADYYSLYGVFLNSTERRELLSGPPTDEAWNKGLQKREQAFQQAMQESRAVASERMRSRIVDYFIAQTELQKYPQEGFDQILSTEDLIPNLVRRLSLALVKAKHQQDPRFTAWHLLNDIPEASFSEESPRIWQEIVSSGDEVCHPRTRTLFADPPTSMKQVARAYAEMISREDADIFHDFLYEDDSPFVIPNEMMYGIEGLFDSNTCNELWKLQNEVDRWILAAKQPVQFAMTLHDRDGEYPSQVFRRGDPSKCSEVVSRHMLSMLTGDHVQPFEDGKDRLQLAEQIVANNNPLTARVWVNRIWRQYFGEGLVRTPSDFGLRADKPSHPELLDWLAAKLIEEKWSTKAIHRLILSSATYRQGSMAYQSPDILQAALRIDPENRLLWHMAPKRLSFEAMRDSLLAASRDLASETSDRHGSLFPTANEVARRTIYCSVDRQFVPTVMRVFDYANPDLHSPKRNETAVPQQSLFSLNHPFVADSARSLIASLNGATDKAKLDEIFLRVLQRKPELAEQQAMLRFLANIKEEPRETIPKNALDWSYGVASLVIDELSENHDVNASKDRGPQMARIENFKPLPNFNGTAWQGSEKYPDGQFGWAQLTATGGHPGNDLQHAVVRRWTAPRDMNVNIKSRLSHEEKPGDGVRAWVISNRQGSLATGLVHNSRWDWESDSLKVEAGEQLDFVVDIYQVLNTDQYLWNVTIDQQSNEDETADSWNSGQDFHGPQVPKLDAWERLAQVLLISNEAVFIE